MTSDFSSWLLSLQSVPKEAKEVLTLNIAGLTSDQQAALDSFAGFLMSEEKFFVIEGYSGTGKSTLLKTILNRLPELQKTCALLDPDYKELDVVLTATTNKAVEALRFIVSHEVKTLHRALGLRVVKSPTGGTTLSDGTPLTQKLVFVDEASYVDAPLEKTIDGLTIKSKVVYLGDPAQLTAVKCQTAPVFSRGWPTAKLKQVMRQSDGNPIAELSAQFRDTVETRQWHKFKPDGVHVAHVDREAFDQELLATFASAKRLENHKMLCWTNQRAVDYNKALSDRLKGSAHFQEGDYAINNSFRCGTGWKIGTDEMVQLEVVGKDYAYYGYLGKMVRLSGISREFFLPDNPVAFKKVMEKAQAGENTVTPYTENWLDLRAAYACTINKAQGSTYESVFIDLDDIGRCTHGNQIARMMYVAVSRAQKRVVLTGEL